ncbi:RHS repeat protein [Escherichia coli]|nr:RHS repeat protein [Escherichia coli]EFI4200624.1 RHS repeat protein [Escherichia coli]EFI4248359.1 RHS repeat protein [Escherichia coli]
MLDRLESEILADRVSEESRRWLASCGLTVAQMQNQMEPVYTPARKIHLYHCDHRGLPLALVSTEGATEWCAEYDEWGNLLSEDNPHHLQQLIRLPGQQYDEESGLYYNRHRYYDPLQGRYITQDPIGLKGGWNFYQYPLNPITDIDPLGLATCLYSITLGMLSCVSVTPSDDNSYGVLTISVASGNNGNNMQCKNNPGCTHLQNRGPIPPGVWSWNVNGPGATNRKPNGIRLVPSANTETYNRDGFLTHSCLNAFGPSLGPRYCSERCITGSSNDMQKLNELIFSEPDSTLTVTD